MRAVIQRVKHAQVESSGRITGRIGLGLAVLLGVEDGDTEKDADYIVEKTVNLRIFKDDEGKFNLSLIDAGALEVLVVSQFTLSGDCRRGRRPSFISAARPEKAEELYNYYMERLMSYGIHVECGVFQADMDLSLCNWGPVTILLDSRKLF